MSVVLKVVLLGVICLMTASLIGGGLYWHQIRANHLKSLQSHQMKPTTSLNTTTMFLNATTPLNAPLNTTTETNDLHPVESLHLPNMQTGSESESGSKRSKRAIIFRPLFVYRQQEIKKQRLQEERDRKLIEYYAYHATSTTTTTQRPKYASYYPYMSSTRH